MPIRPRMVKQLSHIFIAVYLIDCFVLQGSSELTDPLRFRGLHKAITELHETGSLRWRCPNYIIVSPYVLITCDCIIGLKH